MPSHRLDQHLGTVHELLTRCFTPDAVATVEVLINTLKTDSAQLHPDHRPSPPPAILPPTFFRMTVGMDLIEIGPRLLEQLDLDHADQLLGDQWARYITPDEELKQFWNRWGYAAQTHQAFVHAFAFRTPKGRHLTLFEHVWPMREPNGEGFHGWFAHVRVVSKVVKIDQLRVDRDRRLA